MIKQHFGYKSFETIWQAMQARQKQKDTLLNAPLSHAIWYGQHPPVYTLGQQADLRHCLQRNPDIPLLRTDRGGQITYHGPGQLMFYVLLNLKTLGWGIRRLVNTLESLLIAYLAEQGIEAYGKQEARGVYINDEKVASIGLRVSQGHSYHGMAINVDMDLTPFQLINPCGHEGLRMTQLRTHGIHTSPTELGQILADRLADWIEQGHSDTAPLDK